MQGSGVKEEHFVPGTPEPSTELRRLQSLPSAQGDASLLQTSPQPAPCPSAPFSQAETKPWQVWVWSLHVASPGHPTQA